MISSSRNEEMSSGIDEIEAEVDAGGNAEGKARLQDFLLFIAKISQGLYFCYAQFFAMPCIFAMIAKVTVHSENLNFCYALYFRYDSEISLS